MHNVHNILENQDKDKSDFKGFKYLTMSKMWRKSGGWEHIELNILYSKKPIEVGYYQLPILHALTSYKLQPFRS
jgi:hypothetical protein